MLQEEARRAVNVHSVDGAYPLAATGAVPVSRALHVTRGPAVIARPVPVAAPRSPIAPLLAGLCCLGLILFLIAATIVLSLIPIYTSTRNISPLAPTENVTLVNPVENGSVIDAGNLNAPQRALIQNRLQGVLNSDPETASATVSVPSSVAVATNQRRKRQAVVKAAFVRSVVIITFRGLGRIRAKILRLLRAYIIPLELAILIQNLKGTTTTQPTITITTTVAAAGGAAATTTTVAVGGGAAATTTTQPANSTSANGTRILVRRSLGEGGAPAGMVYIDSHQMASVKGNVKSVSFYVDESCATSTVEIAAFDLMDRNLGTNTAELTLTARSGALKLADEKDLKSYMTQITIRLCTGEAVADSNSGGCQGHQFPVLAHQYFGIRSDTCRFGFADTPSNPVLATTWKVSGVADPFAAPYQRLSYVPSDYTILQSVGIDSGKSDFQGGVVEQKTGTTSSPRVLFIGSYPPRRCGLATFLDDITDNYPGPHSVVAMDENSPQALERNYPDEVIYRLNETNRDAYFYVADLANSEAYDVVNIQHEYGLFGGMAGEYVITLIGAILKPVVITMHTVIPEPTSTYMSVTRAVCATATKVVVLSDLGRRLLTDVYEVEETKIIVIPHGVPDVKYSESLASAKEKLGYDASVPTIATFGLVHRNKNIQFGLQAMTKVIETVPEAMYIIIGQTHPMVQLYEGESYRRELEGNVSALGLTKNVEFVDKYVGDTELLDYLAATDIYLTPYAREDQYVSGTLAWAVGLGKAVVSTPYLYAKELLADGRGFLVPFGDHEFLGSTITNLIQDEDTRNGARRQAYKFGRQMAWPVVCQKLQELFRELLLFT